MPQLTAFLERMADVLTANDITASATYHRLTVLGTINIDFSLRGRSRDRLYMEYRYLGRMDASLVPYVMRTVLSHVADHVSHQQRMTARRALEDVMSSLRKIAERVGARIGATHNNEVTVAFSDPRRVLAVLLALATGPGSKYDRGGFILSVLEDPSVALIFSDWLEENDDELAPLVRQFFSAER